MGLTAWLADSNVDSKLGADVLCDVIEVVFPSWILDAKLHALS